MPIGYVNGATGYQNGGTTVAGTIPAAVSPGDVLFAFHTLADVAVGNPSISGGAGSWVLIDGPIDDNNTRTKLWYKVCASGDAGSTATVSWTGSAKAGVILEAYTGTHPQYPVGTASGLILGVDYDYIIEPSAGDTTHDAPGVLPPAPDCWVVEFVGERSAALASFTAPAGRTSRHTQLGSGAGTVGQISADSNGIVSHTSPSGAQTYTADLSTANAVGWSVALRPPDVFRRPAPIQNRGAVHRAARW